MESRVILSEVEKIISKTYFHNDGDVSEQQWWTFFKERFPNCETFWRYFIVPFTKRVDPQGKSSENRIYAREDVSDDIKTMGTLHYSMLKKLIYSYDHLQNFRLSSFEDFYTHLVSSCDLAEEFLLKVYLITLECKDQKSSVLQELDRDKFLELAGEWYDKNYSKVYENYFKKGKFLSIKIPNRKNVLDEYFNKSENWKEYKKFGQKIREYRNVIVHNVQIGKVLVRDNVILVPKKEKIDNYKELSSVFAAAQDIQKLKVDFINMKEQMILDIGALEIILNNLWNKPIEDLKTMLYEEKNPVLLNKYNIGLG